MCFQVSAFIYAVSFRLPHITVRCRQVRKAPGSKARSRSCFFDHLCDEAGKRFDRLFDDRQDAGLFLLLDRLTQADWGADLAYDQKKYQKKAADKHFQYSRRKERPDVCRGHSKIAR